MGSQVPASLQHGLQVRVSTFALSLLSMAAGLMLRSTRGILLDPFGTHPRVNGMRLAVNMFPETRENLVPGCQMGHERLWLACDAGISDNVHRRRYRIEAAQPVPETTMPTC